MIIVIAFFVDVMATFIYAALLYWGINFASQYALVVPHVNYWPCFVMAVIFTLWSMLGSVTKSIGEAISQ